MTDKSTDTADAPAPDAVRDAFILCATPAAAARVLGVPGKWLRDILRGMGTYVGGSHGADASVYDEEKRGALYDAARARLDKRNAPHGDGS